LERKERERMPELNGPHDLEARSDFCFVAQSFQKHVNIGVLLRCADAGLAKEIIIVGRKGWKKRGAMGGTASVPYRHFRYPSEAIEYLKENGHSLVAVEKNEQSVNLFDCVYPPKPAFVLGNEVYGVYKKFLDAADLIVEIPMYGHIDSLNVAVSGAVVMYDYLQKKNKGEKNVIAEKNSHD